VRRPYLALVLSFLLLGMQQVASVHAFEHLASRHEQGAAAPHEVEPCATCELLASGADGIPSPVHATAAECDTARALPVAFTSRTVAAPSCYASRAPPSLS
jgi:hypothetical protein